jgi:DNA-binding transcriptional LysR family regulator
MEFDNLNVLRVLLAIADTGSLTAAGRQLDLSTAAVSAAIKRHENSLGVRLFERTTRSVRPTAEGEVMIDHARRALELVAEGQAKVRHGSLELSGTICITASVTMARELLVDWLAEFAARHPAIEINLQVSDAQLDLVRDAIDVAVRNGPLIDSSLVARLLAPARRLACASPAYLAEHGVPRHPRDLAHHQCLVSRVRDRIYDRWQFEPAASPGTPTYVKVSGRLACHDASVAHQWALAGRGITYQSELVVAHSLASGALIRLLPNYMGEDVPLYAVMPSSRFVPTRVSVLVGELSKLFRQQLKLLRQRNSAAAA